MKYENIEDKLGLGKHILKIEPQDEWDKEEGKFIKGKQRTGISKTGNKWWMYSIKDHQDSKGHRFKILAFDQNQKDLFDTGTVEMVVLQGKTFELDDDGEPVRGADGKSIKKKKAFFNPVRDNRIEDVDTSFNQEEISMQDIEGMF